MGETGCGKTRLIKFMCELQAGPDGPKNLLLMKVCLPSLTIENVGLLCQLLCLPSHGAKLSTLNVSLSIFRGIISCIAGEGDKSMIVNSHAAVVSCNTIMMYDILYLHGKGNTNYKSVFSLVALNVLYCSENIVKTLSAIFCFISF